MVPSLLLCATSRCSRATDSFSLRKEKRVNSISFLTAGEDAPHPRHGGVPARRSGNPPGRALPYFFEVFNDCVIVSFCGSPTELTINQQNLYIICSVRTPEGLMALLVWKQTVQIRPCDLFSCGPAHQPLLHHITTS